MYDAIDLIELKRMADLAEATPEKHFDMGTYLRIKECGTVGCLLGTWSLNTPDDRLQIFLEGDDDDESTPMCLLDSSMATNMEGAASLRFGIIESVADFLFLCSCDLSQSQAIARLRKYIRYVERKRALFAEYDWMMGLSRKDRRERMLAPRELTCT